MAASPGRGHVAHLALDLSTGTPHPDLLPDLGPIIARVSRQTLTSSYLDSPVLPQLDEALRASWPFVPEELTVVDGALDALDRVASVVVRLGDRVAVEHPTFPPVLDLLERLGAEVVGVDVDDEGLSLVGLRAALERSVSAVIVQPRAQNPSGVSMTSRRAKAVAALVASSGAVIVEDDHAGDIATDALVSLGAHLPERTVHIRSYSKSHGPDLRLAAVGGAGEIVTAVANRRLLGPGWSSRILQAVLVGMARRPDDDCRGGQGARRVRPAARRGHPRAAASAGWSPAAPTGSTCGCASPTNGRRSWPSPPRASARAPGEPFMVRADDDHLRVTVGLIDRDIERVAAKLADAAGPPLRRSGHR